MEPFLFQIVPDLKKKCFSLITVKSDYSGKFSR